jgi:type II secretory pathway pseudopilin PulG
MSFSRNRAFTLIELLISLALMIMLMVGVNYIFASVGKASSSAISMSKMMRDVQGAQAVLNNDFSGIATSPFLIISSEFMPAFSTNKDEISAKDPANPLIDDDGNTQSAAIYNERNHRTDTLSYFARGNFPRMTGNDGQFVAEQRSGEAWIWYGHLMLDNDAAVPKRMGATPRSANPNNYYSSQWAVGRVAMLLVTPDSNGKIVTEDGIQQNYIRQKTTSGLSPLAQGSQADDADSSRISSSRYDLAGTSIDGFNQILGDWIKANPNEDWWGRFMADDRNPADPSIVQSQRRFSADPFMRGKPLDSAAFARRFPIFLEHCSQFIVEYSGDFLTQDQNGNITAFGPDGDPDYVLVGGAKVRRWYGMPRDVNGDGKIPASGNAASIIDVVPLRDVLTTAGITVPTPFFERAWPVAAPPVDYMTAMPSNYAQAFYCAAWGPDVASQAKPSLIRIIFQLEDPTNGTRGGWNELIFRI